jgi:hypothetical protein
MNVPLASNRICKSLEPSGSRAARIHGRNRSRDDGGQMLSGSRTSELDGVRSRRKAS